MSNELQLSVVVPLHNEEAILWGNLEQLAGHFNRIVGAGLWQFLLVDNVSTDSTPDLIRQAAACWPPTEGVYAEPPNYSCALRAGLESARAPWVHTIDIEQWDIPFFEWAWLNRERYDLFLASKRADPTLNQQKPYRRVLTWGLQSLLQLLAGYPGSETHGPKLLRMASMRPVLGQCRLDRGQYDTEFVLRGLRAGLRMVEVPVPYVEARPARNLMLKKILWNFVAVYRLQRLLAAVPYDGPVVLHRFSRKEVLELKEVRLG